MTQNEIEKALDTFNLWIEVGREREWRVRRNGRTQTWKRAPDRFSIPMKAGFRDCGRITENSVVVIHPNNPSQLLIKEL